MGLRGATSGLTAASDERVAEQLARILASRAFRQADRLRHLLTFLVNETAAGRGNG